MAIAKESEVRAILNADREKKIKEAYRLAWKDWWNSNDRQKLNRWPRTRANNLFEYLATRLIAEFLTDQNAIFRWERESFKLVIDDKLVIRFKKSNNHGVGSNIGTQAEMHFCDIQADLPGYPEHQKVEIVYSLNFTESDIAEITVLARNGDRRGWSYEITGSGEAEVFQFIQPQQPTTGIDIERMITPKKVDKPAEGNK